MGIAVDGCSISLVQVLKQAGLTASTSEAMRMIEQGWWSRSMASRSRGKGLLLEQKTPFVVQVGKRKFARVTLS